MNVQDLLNTNANVSVTIGLPELREFAMCIINEVKQAQDHEQQPESYLTPDEVAKLFGITRNSLWRWSRLNYLVPIKCGRRLHYRKSDVDNLLQGKGGAV